MNLRSDGNIIRLFKISWSVLLTFIMCDLTITNELSIFGTTSNVQLSTTGIIIFIVTFIAAMPLKQLMKVKLSRFDLGIIILLSSLVVTALISSMLGKYPVSSLMTTFFRYFLLFVCFVCTMIYCSMFRELRIFIIYSFIYINVLLTISCLLDFYVPEFNKVLMEYFGHMMPGESSLKYGGVIYIRPSGFLTETNLTALSLVISNLLLLFNIDKFRRKWPVYINYLVTGYVFGMLGSRSALLMYIILLITAYIFKLTARKEIIYFFLIFTIIQLTTPQTMARYFSSTERKRMEKYETEVGRVLIWKSSFEAFKTNPLIGVGTDGFYKESLLYINMFKSDKDFESEYEKLEQTGKGGVNSHSIFLTILTEYGIIGFILLIAVIVIAIRYAYKNRYYLSLLLIAGLLFVSAISSYAPYYKFYLAVCMIIYVNINNDLKLFKKESKHA